MDGRGNWLGGSLVVTPILAIFLGALLASAILTDLARRIAVRHRMLDVPNSRSSHAIPTPRGGGIAIVVVVVVALLACAVIVDGFLLPGLVIAAAALAVASVGWVDDRQGLPPLPRFTVHVLAIVAVLVVTWPLGSLEIPGLPADGWSGALLAVIAMAWLLNLVNFMDGIDGIAAVEVTCVCGGLVACTAGTTGVDQPLLILSMAMAGAAVGFLAWNWPPARIFMGDVGSGFAGFMLGALALLAHRTAGLSLWVPTILLAAFVTDATVTLLRRVARGERWYEAHRSHAYQRLSRRFHAHLPVILGVLAINVFWLLPLAMVASRKADIAGVIAGVAYAPLLLLALWAGAGRPESMDKGA